VSFEPFAGSVALTELEKFPHKATCDPVVLAQEFPISAGRKSVNCQLGFFVNKPSCYIINQHQLQ